MAQVQCRSQSGPGAHRAGEGWRGGTPSGGAQHSYLTAAPAASLCYSQTLPTPATQACPQQAQPACHHPAPTWTMGQVHLTRVTASTGSLAHQNNVHIMHTPQRINQPFNCDMVVAPRALHNSLGIIPPNARPPNKAGGSCYGAVVPLQLARLQAKGWRHNCTHQAWPQAQALDKVPAPCGASCCPSFSCKGPQPHKPNSTHTNPPHNTDWHCRMNGAEFTRLAPGSRPRTPAANQPGSGCGTPGGRAGHHYCVQ